MKTIRFLLLVSFFTLLLYASELLLEDVLSMYQKDTLADNKEALHVLEDEATKGNTNAAFLLATSYKNGKAGEINAIKAMHWYRVSAKSGDADAMLMLGWMYYKEPREIKMNLKKARYWFKKAASHGVEEAVEMLDLIAK